MLVTTQVPWSRLGKEPVVLLIDQVYVIAEPSSLSSSSQAQVRGMQALTTLSEPRSRLGRCLLLARIFML